MEPRDYQWENKNKIATVRFKCPFCGELVMTQLNEQEAKRLKGQESDCGSIERICIKCGEKVIVPIIRYTGPIKL